MASGLLYIGASDAASSLGSEAQSGGVLLDLGLRVLGLIVFLLLTVRNRQQVDASPATGGSVESESV
jgi:hypothetical protein